MIVTDQDGAMKLAIEEVLTESKHILCMWHIMQKILAKFNCEEMRKYSGPRRGFQRKLNEQKSKHEIYATCMSGRIEDSLKGRIKYMDQRKAIGNEEFNKSSILGRDYGYGDYKIGNVTISRVYFVEGLGHNLFSVGQFCDSDLEVTFRQYTCFIRNLDGVDLLTSSRGNNLYTLSLQDMMTSSLICLLSKAFKTKSWLWHRRLSHLKFGAINHLARQGLVRGLPKLKFEKDHLCSACAMGKSDGGWLFWRVVDIVVLDGSVVTHESITPICSSQVLLITLHDCDSTSEDFHAPHVLSAIDLLHTLKAKMDKAGQIGRGWLTETTSDS
nr:retrovirus-related Pol polyprotein from transposon TNT 1-94 [Tanacetum cinerariifolium]